MIDYKTLYDTVSRRRSVRAYTGERVAGALTDKIKAFAVSIGADGRLCAADGGRGRVGATHTPQHVPLSGAGRASRAELVFAGAGEVTYDKTGDFIVAYYDGSDAGLVAAGYRLQYMDLYIQSLGLGSLWLGGPSWKPTVSLSGTADRQGEGGGEFGGASGGADGALESAGGLVGAADIGVTGAGSSIGFSDRSAGSGEGVSTCGAVAGGRYAIMLAFGYPLAGKEPRTGAEQFDRLPIEKIANVSNAVTEAARLAPSAMNSQPWKITYSGSDSSGIGFSGGDRSAGGADIGVTGAGGVGDADLGGGSVSVKYAGRGAFKLLLKNRLSKIDLGIVTAHVDIALAATGTAARSITVGSSGNMPEILLRI